MDLPSGLSTDDADARLTEHGPNTLPTPSPPSPVRLLLAQFVHFFALLLWVAAGLAFLSGTTALGVAIVLVVILNGVFAFAQEFRAERAATRLRELLPQRIVVVRDRTRMEIDTRSLVVDDVVLLGPGDQIPADVELLNADALEVDTSTLTGESVPNTVGAGETVYAGTFVVNGEAVGRVQRVGADTRLAEIAELTRSEDRPESPLTIELNRVVRVIALLALSIGVAFFGVSILLGRPIEISFLFAIGVLVALIPEGLLPTVTLSLAYGAKRMARRNALVRHLESVETLGSVTFVCTDKTGTLTRNEMSVVEAWTPDGTFEFQPTGYDPTDEVTAPESAREGLRTLGLAGVRASTGRVVESDGQWAAQGDPTEVALDVFARRLGVDVVAAERDDPRTRRFPFDAERRRMSVVAGDTLYVKGAPESVLPRCDTDADLTDVVAEMTEQGLRVLAVATRPAADISQSDGPDVVESDLRLRGIVGMRDPPRTEVRSSIAACRDAGVKVVMLTGDHPVTARRIARDVGLSDEVDPVLEGADLPSDEQLLGALLDRDGTVVSRVDPEDKLRVATALQDRGHVVAMTGDGVNDGPALQQADIGVAMGVSGTDVAREAADLVLLDDNFETIVAAIELGRTTFSNVRRFLTYHLTDNVAELTPFVVWAISGGDFPLAIGVLQILAIDLGTDVFPALALGIEPPHRDGADEPISGRHLIDESLLGRVFGVLGPTLAAVGMAAFVGSLWSGGWGPDGPIPDRSVVMAASGAAFSAIVIGQMANAFACRSTTQWPGALGWTSNRPLVLSVLTGLVVLAVLLFVDPLASLLGHAPPPLVGAVLAAAAAPAVLVADLLHKSLLARQRE
jgi:magnesium-transporting ATPase (P-type)